MKRIEQERILRYRQEKEANELDLARSLYKLYRRNTILNPIRELVYQLIEQVVAITEHYAHHMETGNSLIMELNRICGGERHARVWRLAGGDASANGLKRLLRASPLWTITDCSDLIRLFGEVVEKGRLWSVRDRGKAQFREPDGGPFEDAFEPEHRSRRRGAPPPRLPDHVVGHVLLTTTARGSGIARTTLSSSSTVKAMDTAFGLPPVGCDISGTTADSLFAVKLSDQFFQGVGLGAYGHLLPVLQLLPLVTMVSQYHHTILECALTLTLNGYIKDYCVGYYKTLWPMADTPAQGPFTAIWDELERAEDDQRNHRVLVWSEEVVSHRGPRRYLYGYEMNSEPEKKKFKKVASVTDSYQRIHAHYRADPKKTCHDMLREHGFALELQMV